MISLVWDKHLGKYDYVYIFTTIDVITLVHH